MCNCDKCQEKKDTRVMSVRFIGYSFLGLGTALLTHLPLDRGFTGNESYVLLLGATTIIIGAYCLSAPSGMITKYLSAGLDHKGG